MENENITPVVEEPVIEKPIVPQVPVEPAKKNNLFKIALIIIGILVAIGLFTNAYLMFFKKETTIKTSDSSVVATPTPNPTADWKTYTNKIGYSLKYPEDWYVYERVDGQKTQYLTQIQNIPDPKDPMDVALGGHGPAGSIVFQIDNVSKDSDNLGANTAKWNVQTDGKTVTAESGVDGNGNYFYSVFLPKNNKFYNIAMYDPSGNLKSNQKLFIQILSTFKFIDESNGSTSNKLNIVAPAEWPVYNKEFGYVKFYFKYPSRYSINDNDPSSGSLYFLTADEEKNFDFDFSINSFSNGYDYEEYTSGSRRVWYLNNLTRQYNNRESLPPLPKIDFSKIIFTEINFANGNSCLKVTNFPKEMERQHDLMYFGIQGTTSFFLDGIKTGVDEDEILKILSTIKVSKADY